MTLYQMSFVYREDALRFRMRITVLREQAKAAPTKEERERLKRRILELQQLQRQSRAGRADAALLRKGLLPQ